MLNPKFSGVLILAALLAASCSNEADNIQVVEKDGSVTLTLTPEVQSRVSTDESTTKFDEGDIVVVSSKGLLEDMKNVEFSVGSNGTSLSCDDEYFYDGDDEATFYAYYPSTAIGDTESVSFTVSTDQSGTDSYSANDFMTAMSKGSKAKTPVLSFTHQLAWVKVTIDTGSTESDESEVSTAAEGSDKETISVKMNDILPSVTYTYPTDEAEEKVVTDETVDTKDIAMGENDSEFWALIPAQTIAKGSTFLSITVGNDEYTYTPSTAIEFAAGKVKKISLKIANGVVLEGVIAAGSWTDDDDVISGSIHKQDSTAEDE